MSGILQTRLPLWFRHDTTHLYLSPAFDRIKNKPFPGEDQFVPYEWVTWAGLLYIIF